jgi:hypothetical protein
MGLFTSRSQPRGNIESTILAEDDMKLDTTDQRALLEHYDIQIAKGEHATAPGTDFAVDGWIDEGGRRIVRARSAAHAAERFVPLGVAGAAELADGLRAYHHHFGTGAGRRMLEHLFRRVSDLFEESGIDAFSLDPVRLHENGYTVVDATFSAPGPLHLKERIGRHGRDRKTFHASGRQ